MKRIDKLIDAGTGFINAKKTEVVFNMVITIIGTGLTLLMLAWLVYQIRLIWGI